MSNIMKTYDIYVEKFSAKSATAVAEGQLVHYDTDGWAPADVNATNACGVAQDTVTAAATDRDLRVLLRGVVKVTSSGAITEGDYVKPSATAGQIQSALDSDDEIIGTATETVTPSGTVTILLGR
jgi:hypothetical protein